MQELGCHEMFVRVDPVVTFTLLLFSKCLLSKLHNSSNESEVFGISVPNDANRVCEK